MSRPTCLLCSLNQTREEDYFIEFSDNKRQETLSFVKAHLSAMLSKSDKTLLVLIVYFLKTYGTILVLHDMIYATLLALDDHILMTHDTLGCYMSGSWCHTRGATW